MARRGRPAPRHEHTGDNGTVAYINLATQIRHRTRQGAEIVECLLPLGGQEPTAARLLWDLLTRLTDDELRLLYRHLTDDVRQVVLLLSGLVALLYRDKRRGRQSHRT